MKYHLKLQKLLRIEFLEKMINSKNAVKKNWVQHSVADITPNVAGYIANRWLQYKPEKWMVYIAVYSLL